MFQGWGGEAHGSCLLVTGWICSLHVCFCDCKVFSRESVDPTFSPLPLLCSSIYSKLDSCQIKAVWEKIHLLEYFTLTGKP